jgi:putative heme iron utilization protein
MSDHFSHEISSRICNHMNNDHADAVVLYAEYFANIANAREAEMLSIDAEGMDLAVAVYEEEKLSVRIQFDHVLTDAEDAHQTLIAMIKQARMQARIK